MVPKCSIDGKAVRYFARNFLEKIHEKNGVHMVIPPEIESEEGKGSKGIHKEEQVPNVSQDQKLELVNLLLKCPIFQDEESIRVLKRELPPQIANAINPGNTPKIHALNIVNAYMAHENDFEHLFKMVKFFDDETKPFHRLRAFINGLVNTDSANSPKVESQDNSPKEKPGTVYGRDISITVSTRLNCDGGAQALFDALQHINDKDTPSIQALKQMLTELGFQINPKH